MKNQLFKLLLLIFVSSCTKPKKVGFDEVTIVDEICYFKNDMSLVTATVTDTFRNGQLKIEYNYKNGKLDGVAKGWFKNGQLEYEYTYKDSLLIKNRSWYKNGQLEKEDNYINGIERVWHKNGQLEYESNYTGNYIPVDGPKKYWNENGQLEREDIYKDGLSIKTRTWHKNGQLKREYNYKDGKLNGLCRSWYINGQLKQRFNGDGTGEQNGIWEFWNEDGTLVSVKVYKDGIIMK